jgi:hypothetical protein
MFTVARYSQQTSRGALALAFGLAVGSVNALAASPHFISAAGSIDQATGVLTCSWKEAGLGNNQLIDYRCSASATATYVCVNRGGANPSAANKTTITAPVSQTGTFSSGKNGQITASLLVQPPGSGSFSCPSGQSLELAQVSYSGVLLEDLTNGVSESLGSFSTGCLLPDVRGGC